MSGDNTEKIWPCWFLAKPKMIAAGGGVQGDALVGASFFFCIKHANIVIIRVNIG